MAAFQKLFSHWLWCWDLSLSSISRLLRRINKVVECSPNKEHQLSLVKISELAEDHLISEAKVSTLDLNCLQVKQPLQLKSQSKQLRLVGKVCDLKSEQVAPMIVVTNVRNGYQATVFQLDETQFSTDYIFLEEG